MSELLRTVSATSYVTPLREGGSLPGIVEADDDGLYVVKFHGAGQGPLTLVAELVAGEVGRALELHVPELVYVQLDAAFGRKEPDYEIRSLLSASAGRNLGLDYLPGSLAFEAVAAPHLDADLASAIVWFDAYVMNVDRTARNTNMLTWGKRLWLIDHGAALYFHHGSASTTDVRARYLAQSQRPFAPIREHVLLPYATRLREADERLRPRLTDKVLARIVAAVPDEWLAGGEPNAAKRAEGQRVAYVAFLQARRDASQVFVEEAERARALRV